MKLDLKLISMRITILVVGFLIFIYIVWWLKKYFGQDKTIIIAIIMFIIMLFTAGFIIKKIKLKKLVYGEKNKK